jgi:hypothetical protein
MPQRWPRPKGVALGAQALSAELTLEHLVA